MLAFIMKVSALEHVSKGLAFFGLLNGHLWRRDILSENLVLISKGHLVLKLVLFIALVYSWTYFLIRTVIAGLSLNDAFGVVTEIWSFTDALAYNGSHFLCANLQFVFIICIYKITPEVNDFNKALARITSLRLCSLTNRTLKKQGRTNMAFMAAFLLNGMVVSGLLTYNTCTLSRKAFNLDYNGLEFILIHVLYGLCFVYCLFSPVWASLHLTTTSCIQALTISVEDWTKAIYENRSHLIGLVGKLPFAKRKEDLKNQPGCPINLEPLQLKDVLNQGLNLLEATKALKSEWISRSLFYEVTFAFLDVIFRLFLAFSFTTYFRTGSILTLTFCTANFQMVVVYFFLTYHLLCVGQKLTNAFEEGKEALQKFSIKMYENDSSQMDEENKHKLAILLDQLGVAGIYRPSNAFEMNFSTGIGAAGIILTYIIVLMQFKVGEKGEL